MLATDLSQRLSKSYQEKPPERNGNRDSTSNPACLPWSIASTSLLPPLEQDVQSLSDRTIPDHWAPRNGDKRRCEEAPLLPGLHGQELFLEYPDQHFRTVVDGLGIHLAEGVPVRVQQDHERQAVLGINDVTVDTTDG